MEKAAVHLGAVTIYSHVHSLIYLDTQGHINMLTELQIRAALRPQCLVSISKTTSCLKVSPWVQVTSVTTNIQHSAPSTESLGSGNFGPEFRRIQLHDLPADEDHLDINLGGLKCSGLWRPSGTPRVQHWPSSSTASQPRRSGTITFSPPLLLWKLKL